MKVWPGQPYPLGATWDGQGVNFALFSENATGVELCLFDDPQASQASQRISLIEQTDYVWHGYVPNLKPGQLYGYRVSGPFAPEEGQRFNPAKLLLDPYAKAISGEIQWSDAMFSYPVNSADPERDQQLDEQDNAANMPKSVVIDNAFDWGQDIRPNIALHESIIYELHVKGFTVQNPQIEDDLKGTYAGLASPPSIDYLKTLGVTAVELLPVHQFVQDKTLVDKGLRNYWGYNTIGFFAPHADYACNTNPGEQVREFKAMVKTLHAAGIEVILDVVYNHTAEGNHYGPTLCFKGIDNLAYYRTVAGNPRFYFDYTGTGNSLNMLHPRTLQLVMDSLRYWITEMHVDGFRFDLASTLARGLHEVGQLSSFLNIIHQDPLISQVKLIAEPWAGPSGTVNIATRCASSGKVMKARSRNWPTGFRVPAIFTSITAGGLTPVSILW
jgi:glycogen operon protein